MTLDELKILAVPGARYDKSSSDWYEVVEVKPDGVVTGWLYKSGTISHRCFWKWSEFLNYVNEKGTKFL